MVNLKVLEGLLAGRSIPAFAIWQALVPLSAHCSSDLLFPLKAALPCQSTASMVSIAVFLPAGLVGLLAHHPITVWLLKARTTVCLSQYSYNLARDCPVKGQEGWLTEWVPAVGCGQEVHLGGACSRQLLLLGTAPCGTSPMALQDWIHPWEDRNLTAGCSRSVGISPEAELEKGKVHRLLDSVAVGSSPSSYTKWLCNLKKAVPTILVPSFAK